MKRLAKFTGEEGSLGLHLGKTYIIDVRANFVKIYLPLNEPTLVCGDYIVGMAEKAIYVTSCPYSNIENFLKNWSLK